MNITQTTLRHYSLLLLYLLATTQLPAQNNEPPVELWRITIPDNVFYTALKTPDEGFLIGGLSFLVKTTEDGVVQWQTQYPYGGTGVTKNVVQQTDGFVYVLSRYNLESSGFFLYKIEASSGDIVGQFDYSFDAYQGNQLWKLLATQDGGFLVVGDATRQGETTVAGGWVVKIDSAGAVEWEMIIENSEEFYGAAQTSDGFFLVCGRDADTSSGMSDYFLTKIDVSGNVVWENTYGGSSSEDAWAVAELAGGNYVLSGATTSHNGDVSSNIGMMNIWIVITDTNGNLLSERCISNPEEDNGEVFLPFTESSIVAEPDGGYVVGMYGVDCENNQGYIFRVIKGSAENNVVWDMCIPNTSMLQDMIRTGDGGYLVVGSGGGGATALKLGYENMNTQETVNPSIDIYPNPATNTLYLKNIPEQNKEGILIYDETGRLVLKQEAYNNLTGIDISGLSKGIYYLHIKSSNLKWKWVKE